MTRDSSENADEPLDEDSEPDAIEAAGLDPIVAPDSDAEFEPDPERMRTLRAIADDVRGEGTERKQLAAILYRVSDLYDPDQHTSPEEIYLNMRHIMSIKAAGGLRAEE
ncbi:hypothetical protein [Halalkalirubrum salinum]|uniref:hypothetical protein n=1 Tax=Halalkalirubrum salinum TaxID=2563889 RepID=UPI0014855D3A|nr:hypothetical protein [Halalkalirubrum salinum]